MVNMDKRTINALYKVFFERHPNALELQAVKDCDSVSDLVEQFINSAEFKRKFLKRHQQANWLYKAKAIFTSGQYASFLFPTYDRFQLSDFLRQGDYQYDEFHRLFAYLRDCELIENNSYFIDIGANVGVHSIYALLEKEIDFVFAVEPLKSNISLFNHNLKINGVFDKVKIINTALGDFDGETKFFLNPVNCGDNRLEPRKETIDEKFNEGEFKTEVVPICTFDNFIFNNNINLEKIGFIWMDVQGAEGLILQPSTEITKTRCPIYIEFWPYGMEKLNSYGKLREFILSNVKTVVKCNKKDLIEYQPDAIDDLYEEFNDSGYNVGNLLLIR